MVEQLERIGPGTLLHHVLAYAEPGDHQGVHIGDVSTLGGCTRSRFGDEGLAFKHQWSEEDYELRPEWRPAAKMEQGLADVSIVATTAAEAEAGGVPGPGAASVSSAAGGVSLRVRVEV